MAGGPDIGALYERHGAAVLRWFVRRTLDAEVGMDLCSETFAQAIVSAARCRAKSDDERAA